MDRLIFILASEFSSHHITKDTTVSDLIDKRVFLVHGEIDFLPVRKRKSRDRLQRAQRRQSKEAVIEERLMEEALIERAIMASIESCLDEEEETIKQGLMEEAWMEDARRASMEEAWTDDGLDRDCQQEATLLSLAMRVLWLAVQVVCWLELEIVAMVLWWCRMVEEQRETLHYVSIADRFQNARR